MSKHVAVAIVHMRLFCCLPKKSVFVDLPMKKVKRLTSAYAQ